MLKSIKSINKLKQDTTENKYIIVTYYYLLMQAEFKIYGITLKI